MKKIAVIIAGGSGSRMGFDVPKQFLTVLEKPIIIYTLESFDKHDDIDEIVLVTLAGWENYIRSYASHFNIKKLTKIIEGGLTGQESIRNGVFALKDTASDDDIIIIHDGIRPIVDTEVLTSVINTAIKYGNGVTSLPYNEQIFIKKTDISTVEYIPRETLRRVQTPQAYNFKALHIGYKKAFEKGIGIHGSSYTNTMMVELGTELFFAKGSEKNIKLTTKEDLEIFQSYILKQM